MTASPRWSRFSAVVAVLSVAIVPSVVFVQAADGQATPNIEVVEQSRYVHRGEKYSITIKLTDTASTDRVAVAVGRVSNSGARVRQTRADLRADLRGADRPATMLASNVVALFPEDPSVARQPNSA